jgi:hypothetical protein
MTKTASTLFGQLVDLNWECENKTYPEVVRHAIVEQYWKVREQLIEEMGIEDYLKFMKSGRELFAPAKD